MSNSRVATLRDMIALKERRLAEGMYTTERSQVGVRNDLIALRYAVELIEGEQRRQHPPMGVAWDHHFAIHSDCDWDWTGQQTQTFTGVTHRLFNPSLTAVETDDDGRFVATYRLVEVRHETPSR